MNNFKFTTPPGQLATKCPVTHVFSYASEDDYKANKAAPPDPQPLASPALQLTEPGKTDYFFTIGGVADSNGKYTIQSGLAKATVYICGKERITSTRVSLKARPIALDAREDKRVIPVAEFREWFKVEAKDAEGKPIPGATSECGLDAAATGATVTDANGAKARTYVEGRGIIIDITK